MSIRKLTDGRLRLLITMPESQIIQTIAPGMSRQDYDDGSQRKLWTVDDALDLERSRLIKLSKDLIQAGVVCPSLTDSGIKYIDMLRAA